MVAQQPKPGSSAAKALRQVEVFSEQQPAVYGDLVSQVGSAGNASLPRITLRRSATVGRAALEEYRQIEQNIRAFTGSGPYRRVLAKPGYSYVDGDVFLLVGQPSFEPATKPASFTSGDGGLVLREKPLTRDSNIAPSSTAIR